jgi:hypothetical protein
MVRGALAPRWTRFRSVRAPLLLLLLAGSIASPAAQAQRVLVLAVGGDVDERASTTLGRAVETAVRDAMPDAEVMTTASLQTSIAVSQLQDCTNEEAIGACVSEIADAANAEAVVRPHLGRLGDELLLTLTVTSGSSARLMAQGQRRAPSDRPSALLDVIPGLTTEVLVDAGLARARTREWPVAGIAVGAGGALVAGLGVAGLAVRGAVGAEYDRGNLNRADAVAWEGTNQAALFAGVGVVVVGASAALIGAGLTAWGLVKE